MNDHDSKTVLWAACSWRRQHYLWFIGYNISALILISADTYNIKNDNLLADTDMFNNSLWIHFSHCDNHILFTLDFIRLERLKHVIKIDIINRRPYQAHWVRVRKSKRHTGKMGERQTGKNGWNMRDRETDTGWEAPKRWNV